MKGPKTLILCGGKGVRAYPHTADLPKPLMKVGEEPILRHIMEIFAAQGFSDFVLAGGFRVDLIESFASGLPPAWNVEVIDTGEDTGTAGRVAKSAHLLGPTFFATYGDGLGDVDLRELLRSHRSHDGAATVTVVPLPSQYGVIEWDGTGRVTRFVEKPKLGDHWINAGFFAFDDVALSQWEGDDLEREVLPALAESGQLHVYRHDGFWRSMDTYKDALELSAMWREGDAPWTTSSTSQSSSRARRASSART